MSSYDNLVKFGYNKVTYIPDISIILGGDKENGNKLISQLFEKNKCDKYNKVYTIVVNSHLVGNSNTSFKDKIMFFKMINDTVECIDSTSASFLFLPSQHSQPRRCRSLVCKRDAPHRSIHRPHLNFLDCQT